MCPSLTVQIGNSYLWGWFHPEVTWLHGSSAFEVYWGGGLSGCWCCCWVSRWSREAARLSSFMGETDALAEGSRGNSWRGPNHDLARLAGVDIKSSSYQWNFHKFKNFKIFSKICCVINTIFSVFPFIFLCCFQRSTSLSLLFCFLVLFLFCLLIRSVLCSTIWYLLRFTIYCFKWDFWSEFLMVFVKCILILRLFCQKSSEATIVARVLCVQWQYSGRCFFISEHLEHFRTIKHISKHFRTF